jgi:hypothetical protein
MNGGMAVKARSITVGKSYNGVLTERPKLTCSHVSGSARNE